MINIILIDKQRHKNNIAHTRANRIVKKHALKSGNSIATNVTIFMWVGYELYTNNEFLTQKNGLTYMNHEIWMQ
jgi:hypothetical protein